MSNKIPLAIADLELQIATAVGIGDETFELASAVDDDGLALPAGIYCFTVDNGTSQKEYLLGQLNGTTVTSVKSVSRQGIETTGAARKHRIGASAIVTNFAALQRVADILRGELTLDGGNPLSYDVAPTLSDNKELATVGYVLATVTGGDVSFDKQTVAGTAGATVVLGDLVYFDEADQEWKLCDADTAATVEGVMRGIALGSGSDGVAITGGVHLAGVYTTTGLTAGAIYYASNTAGGLATSAGTTKHIVGVALSTTRLWVIPQHRETISTRTKDALAGGGDLGTPSASNKFVTEDKLKNSATLSLTRTVATGTTSRNIASAGTQTIPHGLGTTPTYVSLKAVSLDGSSKSGFSMGEWYAGGFVSSVSLFQDEGGSTAQPDSTQISNSQILRCYSDPADIDYSAATVVVDSTNITLTWTSNNAPAGNWQIVWLAKVEDVTYS